jgi:hypothetical protein
MAVTIDVVAVGIVGSVGAGHVDRKEEWTTVRLEKEM